MIFKLMYKKALFIALSALLCACSSNENPLQPEQLKKLDELKDGVKERSETRQQRREAIKEEYTEYQESGATPNEYIEEKKQDIEKPKVDTAIPNALDEKNTEKPDLSTYNIDQNTVESLSAPTTLEDTPSLGEVEVSSDVNLESKVQELELPPPEKIDPEEVNEGTWDVDRESVKTEHPNAGTRVKKIQKKRASAPKRLQN
jgi:hypothetical protein